MKFVPVIVILILVLACEEVVQKPELPGFIGTWVVQSATEDGVLRTEWENQVITFEAETETTGTYELAEPVWDSVWNQTGTWEYEIGSVKTLTRDNGVVMVVTEGEDLLDLRFFIAAPCDWCCTIDTTLLDSINFRVDTTCLLTFNGAWQFVFERAEIQ